MNGETASAPDGFYNDWGNKLISLMRVNVKQEASNGGEEILGFQINPTTLSLKDRVVCVLHTIFQLLKKIPHLYLCYNMKFVCLVTLCEFSLPLTFEF